MENYLVDVPVKINIWIREELQKKQFDVIRLAKPSIIFIQSDGGRNEKEWNAIRNNRKMIDDGIDWNCKVYRVYEDHNNGFYAMSKKMHDLVWSTVDRCIFMEDDIIPAVSFFRYCKELLDKYENDYRVFGICGYNPLNVYEDVNSDYFFSGESNSWGNAYWKRSLVYLDENFSYINDEYVMKLMKYHLGNYAYQRAIKCAKDKMIDGHAPGGEFKKGLARATQNALFIIPKKNLLSNHGCTSNSIHSNSMKTLTKKEQGLYSSPVYEISDNIKHPHYVIRDVFYEKKIRRLLGVGHPIIRLNRRMIKFAKTLKYQGFSGLKKKLLKTKQNKHEN